MARFRNVTPDVPLISATGPSVNRPRCRNAEFRNPATGKKMFVVYWRNHHGLLPSPIPRLTVDPGGQKVINYVTRTPKDQKQVCGGHRTTWIGTKGNDTYAGTPGTDVINALGGNDVISGRGGNDVICGGPGRDTLSGNKGGDLLLGEQGNDTLNGGPGNDLALIGGPGRDVCRNGENTFDCEG